MTQYMKATKEWRPIFVAIPGSSTKSHFGDEIENLCDEKVTSCRTKTKALEDGRRIINVVLSRLSIREGVTEGSFPLIHLSAERIGDP